MESSNFILTAIEVAGIQNYIFGSNELKENIGASELVRRATEDIAFEELTALMGPNNHNLRKVGSYFEIGSSKMIEKDPSLGAELFYAAGGSTIIIFRDLEKAKKFVYRLSKQLHRDIPGLPVYAAHKPFNWSDPHTNLAVTLANLLAEVKQVRGKVGPSAPILGLSVTASCKSTGLPANHNDPHERAVESDIPIKPVVSKSVYNKVQMGRKLAKDRLQGLFSSSIKWTDEFDEIGRDKSAAKEESLIAVVHIDGNSMGKRFVALNQLFQKMALGKHINRAFIMAQRNLSDAVKDIYEAALKATVRRLDESERAGETGAYFPFRPIVFGGDDITWVCRSGLGLPLAHYFLQQLEKGEKLPGFEKLLSNAFSSANAGDSENALWKKLLTEEPPNENLSGEEDRAIDFRPMADDFVPYAAAGVSIVKTHYPFSRAYDLSEDLAKSAKNRLKTIEEIDGAKYDEVFKEGYAIDWHLTHTGIQGRLEQIRRREFTCATAEQQTLIGRPYVWGKKMEGKTWRSWATFSAAKDGFSASAWREAKNKRFALREAYRSGPEAIQQFLIARRNTTKEKKGDLPELRDVGHSNGFILEKDTVNGSEVSRAVYFDAIEIIDQFELLKQPKTEEVVNE